MKADCHMHMILDGYDWRQAIQRHDPQPDDAFIHRMLAIWQEKGYTYLRDGGDRWSAGKRARELAPMYGITYVTPLAPLCREGHYGAFIGKTYRNTKEYAALVQAQKAEGADFIKIMISGLMDFDHFGLLTEEGQDPREIKELIHIAHEEGMAVMAHANGARTVEAAAAAGVNSVEHGAYLDGDALHAMEEAGTVWVPTLSAVGNLLGKGRFPDKETSRILESALYNLSCYQGLVACGTDAGAWAVPHGSETEADLLARGGITQARYEQGNRVIIETFRTASFSLL